MKQKYSCLLSLARVALNGFFIDHYGLVNFILELLRDGFGEDCYFKVILAELDVDSTPIQEPISDTSLPSASMQKNERLIGYVLYYFNYSTWQGRSFYMEDLFIREPYRSELCSATHSSSVDSSFPCVQIEGMEQG